MNKNIKRIIGTLLITVTLGGLLLVEIAKVQVEIKIQFV
ncbi:hypothetical protein B0I63_003945 [Clostridium beijerinckii]|nr:hypothetical protein [Clostridium beijerinckii]